jgi:hypothetical protein
MCELTPALVTRFEMLVAFFRNGADRCRVLSEVAETRERYRSIGDGYRTETNGRDFTESAEDFGEISSHHNQPRKVLDATIRENLVVGEAAPERLDPKWPAIYNCVLAIHHRCFALELNDPYPPDSFFSSTATLHDRISPKFANASWSCESSMDGSRFSIRADNQFDFWIDRNDPSSFVSLHRCSNTSTFVCHFIWALARGALSCV